METGEFLEPILRWMRIRKIRRFIKKSFEILDIGCGAKGAFLKSLSSHIKKGVGIDKDALNSTEGNISLYAGDVDGQKLPFADNSFDCVTMMAVLEHLNSRQETLNEICRVLKPGGILLMTVPTWANKPVLEFLAYKLKIVSSEGVRDHKTYFWKKDLVPLLEKAGFKNIKHKYFQIIFNNFVHARK